ncbi:tumor necrosis factor receptor superfamily member 16-like isoform X3 [Xenia sp. Carnegie-2017]|uniref:tumor necrosis factor receptor superfamily member 16-like isoform X3 n=1 Tax=Xenia sp. Carnegie-2017 TaxID=2897299 RepID=UPI001F039EAC|nr:tumor necrosis factor receptor superfamily member 16-like isoform X3 [Xenia sp. Carnegie-2017]
MLMEVRRWIQILYLLPALQEFLDIYANSMVCPSTHYLTPKGRRCCIKCKAGEKVVGDCEPGRNETTRCAPCPPGEFQESPNGERKCNRCFGYIPLRIIVKECNRTQNRKMGVCIEGYYYNNALSYCQPCKRCLRGYGVKKLCTNETNTECEEKQCALGTYSDKDSKTQKCQPCTNCKKNEKTIGRCNATSNNLCQRRFSTTPTSPLTTQINITKIITTATTPQDSPVARPNVSSSWVIPFFITSMILLLVLFIALVLGVILWCCVHKRQSIIIHSEESRLGQRLSKFNDEMDSGCCKSSQQYINIKVPSEESPFILEEIPRIQENGLMIRDVTHDIIEQLASYLNPINPPSNWRKVASMLDFPWNVINNLALCPTTATQQLLERWGTKRDATVYKLYLTLKDIGRDDAAEVLEKLLMERVGNNKSV